MKTVTGMGGSGFVSVISSGVRVPDGDLHRLKPTKYRMAIANPRIYTDRMYIYTGKK